MNLVLALLLLLPVSADEQIFEGEDGEHIGVEVSTERDGFSGDGYVTSFDSAEDSLVIEFEVDPGVYQLWLGLYVPGRAGVMSYRIDDVAISRTVFGTGETFAERYVGDRLLGAGRRVFVYKGPFDFDYLKLVPVEAERPVVPPEQLANSNATASARALHRFLLQEYGRHMLAGQQSMADVQYVANMTGKVPAIGAFDLMDYSPSRLACGLNPGQMTESWINWADRDGIVTLAWHWNAPTDLIDDDCSASPSEVANTQAWWSGFYTSATTFNFAAALADTTSERYQLLLRDMDAIAVQLRKMADSDIPVLFRPLHEAAGGWFWWGTQGPDAFVELWRLLYDRLVHHNGLDNLIWVYTHEPGAFSWYPGDAYVDVVTRDVYGATEESTMMSDWSELQDNYGDRKLIALSESGTLPNPSLVTAYGIWWSWFAVWSGNFIRDVDPDYLRYVFQHELVMTRDELPDWRALYTTTQDAPSPPSFSFKLYPNPASGRVSLWAEIDDAGTVKLSMFDVAGRLIRHKNLGHQSTGVLSESLDTNLPAGVYLIELRAGERRAHEKLVVLR